MDILCGEYGKKIYIYYGDGKGSVSGGGPITDAEGSQEFGYDRFNGPALIDMNGDGLKDMLVANCNNGTYVNGYDGPGPLRYYQNVGKKDEPLYKFIENVKDTTGTEIAYVYHRVRVADMDNDGLDDLITANSIDKNGTDTTSKVMIYRNCGTKDEYRFEPGVKVTLNTSDNPIVKYAIRLGVSDINNDGVQDLILNTSHHYSGKAGVFFGKLDSVSLSGKKLYSLQEKPLFFSIEGTILRLNGQSNIKVINASGQIIANKKGVAKQIDLQQYNLPSGMHLIQVEQGTSKQVKRFIKK